MAKINFLKIEKIAKGLNVFTRDTMLTNEESTETKNVVACGQTSVTKRPGTATICTIAGDDPIDGLGTYYAGAERHLLAMCNGKLYRVDTGTAVEITGGAASASAAAIWTPGQRTDFCQAGSNVFISNGTDTMRQYDGTKVSVTTNGIVAKHMIYYKNCLYAIGNSSYMSRLYRSGTDTKLGDFTYNASTNPFATSVYLANNDGQDIISFFKYQDYLYCAKNRSLYRIAVGSDTAATITVELVDSARGADSHWASDTVDNDIFMFNEAGIHSIGYEPNFLSQIRTKILSIRVDSIIKSIAKDDLKNTCGMYFDNNYYFSYQKGGATANSDILVYDKYRLGFWQYQLGASCFSEYKNTSGETKLYFGSPTDGKVKYFDYALKSDDGVAFATSWKSPKYSVSDYTQSKFILNALLYMGRLAGTVTATVYVDGVLRVTKTVTLGNSGTGGTGVASIGTETFGYGGGSLVASDLGGSDIIKLPVNKMGRNIQIGISDNSSNKTWELNTIEVALARLNKLYQPNTK